VILAVVTASEVEAGHVHH